MKIKVLSPAVLFLAISLLILISCSPKERTFSIPENDSLTSLTIGWYVPVEALTQLVGPNFKPLPVKDGNGLIELMITVGKKYSVDGSLGDSLKMARLLVAIETPATNSKNSAIKLDESFVCPMTIVDQCRKADDIFKEFGFKTYLGTISLKINRKNERHNFSLSIKNSKGTITATGFFNEVPEKYNSMTAFYNSQPKQYSYYAGEETSLRFLKGRGRIDNEGSTLINAMQLENHPFILILDNNARWEFEFEK